MTAWKFKDPDPWSEMRQMDIHLSETYNIRRIEAKKRQKSDDAREEDETIEVDESN